MNQLYLDRLGRVCAEMEKKELTQMIVSDQMCIRDRLKDPAILILDDTTSAVDMETESYIQKQLKNLEGNHTIFIIAYRISSLKDADQILVLDHGRIAERGTHDELLANNGYYARVFEHQYHTPAKEGR